MIDEPEPSVGGSCLKSLFFLFALVVVIFVSLGLGGWIVARAANRAAPGLITTSGMPFERRVEASYAVMVAEIGEDPHLTPDQPPGAVPICTSVIPQYVRALRSGFALMRATAEGRRLYDQLVAQNICVGVTDLPYNTAYAAAREVLGDWSRSTIMVDTDFVRSLSADVLAAILVHEATHIDRAISHTACYDEVKPNGKDGCTTLANGVQVDEEVVAHTAEAEWWIAAYGKDGKRFAWRSDYAENRLAKAYLSGDDAFRAYITQMRDDPREGEGI